MYNISINNSKLKYIGDHNSPNYNRCLVYKGPKQHCDVKFTDCYVTYIKIYNEHNGVADVEVTFNLSWRIPHK